MWCILACHFHVHSCALVCIHVHALSSLHVFLDTIMTSRPCLGNPDPLFLRLPNIRNAVLKDHSSKYMFDIVCTCMYIHPCIHFFPTGSKVVAVVDSLWTGYPSIYDLECEILVSSSTERCCSCLRHRKSLRVSVPLLSCVLFVLSCTCTHM